MCVCGHSPVTVKSGKRWLLACPDAMRCAVRGAWAANEQQAIKNWNTAVETAKHERSAQYETE